MLGVRKRRKKMAANIICVRGNLHAGLHVGSSPGCGVTVGGRRGGEQGRVSGWVSGFGAWVVRGVDGGCC